MCGNAANLIGCLVILINAQVELLIVTVATAANTVSSGVITTESDWGGQVGG